MERREKGGDKGKKEIKGEKGMTREKRGRILRNQKRKRGKEQLESGPQMECVTGD